MPSATKQLSFAADFAPADEADWRKLVDGVLKGAPFEKLVGKTYDGLPIAPIYRRAQDAAPIVGRAAAAPWQIVQRIEHPDPSAANAQALHDLENGATGLALIFAGARGARGFGLPPTAEAIERALDGVFIDAGIAIELHVGTPSRMAPIHLAELIKRRGLKAAACDIRFGLDPIGDAAVRGSSAHDAQQIASATADAIKGLTATGFAGPFAVADGCVIHDAGGSEAQELAFVLATAVAYLRALENAGVPLETARGMIYARLSADADQFLTLAKFRALRLLWARVEESCGLAPKPLFIAAETAWRMLTQRDPYVNMLRATVAIFSAGLGGASAVSVLPHTLALGLPDAFARRVARNTQLILLEESNLAKVSDPAAGAGGIEALTRELCDAAWSRFQDIDRAGGVFAALCANLIQPQVAQTRAARQTAIAKRREVLTGASEFPNLHEAAAVVLSDEPAMPELSTDPTIQFEPLSPMRLATPFEALRDKSDAMLAETGARPKVLLANLGTAADYTARATFAKSFFETGGIEAIEYLPALFSSAQDEIPSPGPFPSAQDRPPPMGEVKHDFVTLADAFKISGAALVCLCSSDKVYAGHAVAAAQALKAAGGRHIYLAGRPGEMEASLRNAGVETFIIAGGDALQTLQDAYAKLVTT